MRGPNAGCVVQDDHGRLSTQYNVQVLHMLHRAVPLHTTPGRHHSQDMNVAAGMRLRLAYGAKKG